MIKIEESDICVETVKKIGVEKVEPKKNKFPLEYPIFRRLCKFKKSKKGTKTGDKKQIGYLVAGVVNNQLTIGWSLCHKKDTYDMVEGVKRPHWGRTIAINRALKWTGNDIVIVPHSILPKMKKFLERCAIYYKDKSCPQAKPQAHKTPAEIERIAEANDVPRIGLNDVLKEIFTTSPSDTSPP